LLAAQMRTELAVDAYAYALAALHGPNATLELINWSSKTWPTISRPGFLIWSRARCNLKSSSTSTYSLRFDSCQDPKPLQSVPKPSSIQRNAALWVERAAPKRKTPTMNAGV
jgi:hypothetical protein